MKHLVQITHTVLPGDTLSQISEKYGTSIAELLKSNPQITNPDLIIVGQKLNIAKPDLKSLFSGTECRGRETKREVEATKADPKHPSVKEFFDTHIAPELTKFIESTKNEKTDIVHREEKWMLPEVKERYHKLKTETEKKGITIQLIETGRTPQRQDWLFKTAKSNARRFQSMHGVLSAFDVIPVVNGKVDWENLELFKKVADIARTLGLTCGADWEHFRDYPHFSLNVMAEKHGDDFKTKGEGFRLYQDLCNELYKKITDKLMVG